MSIFVGTSRICALFAAAALALSTGSALAKDVQVTLTGAEETPPVTTSASATGTIKINKDGAVSRARRDRPSSLWKKALMGCGRFRREQS
jgi:hypothetical protein